MMLKRIILLLAATISGIALLLALLLLLPSQAANVQASYQFTQDVAPVLDESHVITIGVATMLSGPIDYLGWPQANSVQLAISQTNAAGGVDLGGITYTLVMVAVDDQCDPALAPGAANTLLSADVVAVVGHGCSGASMAAAPSSAWRSVWSVLSNRCAVITPPQNQIYSKPLLWDAKAAINLF